MTAKPISNWLVPGFLLMLDALNVLFSASQLNMIQQGPPVVPDEFTSMHYFETPIPIVLHNELTVGLVVWLGFLLNVSVVEWVLLRERRSASGSIKANLKEAP